MAPAPSAARSRAVPEPLESPDWRGTPDCCSGAGTLPSSRDRMESICARLASRAARTSGLSTERLPLSRMISARRKSYHVKGSGFSRHKPLGPALSEAGRLSPAMVGLARPMPVASSHRAPCSPPAFSSPISGGERHRITFSCQRAGLPAQNEGLAWGADQMPLPNLSVASPWFEFLLDTARGRARWCMGLLLFPAAHADTPFACILQMDCVSRHDWRRGGVASWLRPWPPCSLQHGQGGPASHQDPICLCATRCSSKQRIGQARGCAPMHFPRHHCRAGMPARAEWHAARQRW